MPSTIQLKYSATAAAVPTTGDLTVQGEVAINTADKYMYTRDSGDNIVKLGIQDGTADGNLMRWNGSDWVEVTQITVSGAGVITINATNNVVMTNLPTSDPVNAGELWNDSGTLKVSAG